MKVYFDNAATTQPHSKVVEKMLHYLKSEYGNPSSIHTMGRKVRVAIEEARETAAEFINADPSEIYFTSGGSEANNFALRGISKTLLNENGKNKIITSVVEHHSVMDTCNELSKAGFEIIPLKVNGNSTINIEILEKNIDPNTSLVSAMFINNETGSMNPIDKISAITKNKNVVMHTDAVQYFGKFKIDTSKLSVNALSASAHKIYGPKGIGLLYARSGTPLSPILFGGSQERNRRAGTENVAGILGFAEAIKIAAEEMEENEKIVRELNEYFVKYINDISADDMVINSNGNNSPYLLSITFKGEYFNNDPEAMLMFLDINGVAASNGAACTSGTLKPSHVLLNSGISLEDSNGTIRFSFSPDNTIEEVDYVLDIITMMRKKFRR